MEKEERKDEYNGWKNYPTWVWHLWATNDEFSYNSLLTSAEDAIKMAKNHPNVKDGLWEQDRAEVYILADLLKDETEDRSGRGFERPYDADPDVFSDLMGWAVGEIDFYEIAEHVLEDMEA